MTRRGLLLFPFLLACPGPPGLRAHETRPAFLELVETAPGRFEVTWKVPVRGGPPLAGEEIRHEGGAAPGDGRSDLPQAMPCGCPVHVSGSWAALPIHPSLPESLRALSLPTVERMEGAEVKRWVVASVDSRIVTGTIAIHGLRATMVDVLVRIAMADGRVISRLLRPDAPSLDLTEESAGPAAGAYFMLGVEHILLGVDHLLFVLALVLIVPTAGMLVKTVTCFTIAHSITLALAALGVVHVPPAPVEAVIALSIVFVAAEIVRGREGKPGLTARAPWIIAFTFGLLHGFGFAGALAQVGLPANDIPLALLCFNLGVEAGQLAFVAAALAVIAIVRRVSVRLPRAVELVPPYAIGSVAMFWAIQRLTVL